MTTWKEADHTQGRSTILAAGPDWFAATVAAERADYMHVRNRWYDVFRNELAYAEYQEGAYRLGYDGNQAGKVFIGDRTDGTMIQVTSQGAYRHWVDLSQSGGRCSRLDLQVTTIVPDPDDDLVHKYITQAASGNERLPSGRKRKIRHNQDSDGGWSVYIGSRQSDALGVVYNKHAESADEYPAGAVRFEVRLMGQRADEAVRAIAQQMLPIEDYTQAFIWDFFTKRGVVLPFKPFYTVDSSWREVVELTPLDAKLNWLYNQVAPSVREVVAQGHGHRALRVLFGQDWAEVVSSIIEEERS